MDSSKVFRATARPVLSLHKWAVLCAAHGIALDGNARPMVDGVQESDLCSLVHEDDGDHFERFGDGRNAQLAPTSVKISPAVKEFRERKIPAQSKERGPEPIGV